MSDVEKRGWEDELNAAWAEVNKARRELAGAVDDREALATMLMRLLAVALVDGYGETVRDEAEALLDRLGERTP